MSEHYKNIRPIWPSLTTSTTKSSADNEFKGEGTGKFAASDALLAVGISNFVPTAAAKGTKKITAGEVSIDTTAVFEKLTPREWLIIETLLDPHNFQGVQGVVSRMHESLSKIDMSLRSVYRRLGLIGLSDDKKVSCLRDEVNLYRAEGGTKNGDDYKVPLLPARKLKVRHHRY